MADILKVNINGTVYNIGNSYGTGNATTLGLTKLYTSTGTSTDGTMTRNAITTALNGKANTSSIPKIADAFKLANTVSSAFTLSTANHSKNVVITPVAVSGYTFLCPAAWQCGNAAITITPSSFEIGGKVSFWVAMINGFTGDSPISNIKITMKGLYMKNAFS